MVSSFFDQADYMNDPCSFHHPLYETVFKTELFSIIFFRPRLNHLRIKVNTENCCVSDVIIELTKLLD